MACVYALVIHQTQDVLATGRLEIALRVLYMCIRDQVMMMGGRHDGVNEFLSQRFVYQFVSWSVDSTIRLRKFADGKCASVLIN